MYLFDLELKTLNIIHKNNENRDQSSVFFIKYRKNFFYNLAQLNFFLI